VRQRSHPSYTTLNKKSYDTHQLFVRDFQQHRESAQRFADLRSNLTKYQARVYQMKSDVVRFKQVEDCKRSIEKYEKKIPWVAYQVEKDEHHQIKALLHEYVK
jgi:hypothetical protein